MTEDDPWQGLRRWTPARIALGRTGDALPTRRVLEFQLAHAQARDAVHLFLDVEGLARDLAPLSAVPVRSLARSHSISTYPTCSKIPSQPLHGTGRIGLYTSYMVSG